MRRGVLCLWAGLGLSLIPGGCDHSFAVEALERKDSPKGFFSFFTKSLLPVPQEDLSELKRFCGQRIWLRSLLNCGEKAIRQITASKGEKTRLAGFLLASLLQSLQIALIQSLTESIRQKEILSFKKHLTPALLSFANGAMALFLCKNYRSLKEGQAAFSFVECFAPFVQWIIGALINPDTHLSWKGATSVLGDFTVSVVTQYFEKGMGASGRSTPFSGATQNDSLLSITVSAVASFFAKRQFFSLLELIKGSFFGNPEVLGDRRTKRVSFEKSFVLGMGAYLVAVLGIEWWNKNKNSDLLNRQVCKNLSTYWIQELNKYLNLIKNGLILYEDVPYPELLEFLAVPTNEKMLVGLGGMLMPLLVDGVAKNNPLNHGYAEILTPLLLQVNILDGVVKDTVKKVRLGYTARQEFLDCFAEFCLRLFEGRPIVLQDLKNRSINSGKRFVKWILPGFIGNLFFDQEQRDQ